MPSFDQLRKGVFKGMGAFLKMACHGHLTQVTSQEGTEWGQGGADVPDLNLRLVDDFIF